MNSRSHSDAVEVGRQSTPAVPSSRRLDDIMALVPELTEAGDSPGRAASRLGEIAEHAPIGICLIEDGQVCFANRRLVELLGVPLDGILGRRAGELFAGEEEPSLSVRLERLETGRPVQHRMALRRPDGSRVVVSAFAAPTLVGGRTAVFAAFHDITERDHYERALHESEIRSRLIIEMAHDAFVAVDPDGMIIDWNSQAEKTFGWSRDGAIGRSVVDTLVPVRFRDRYREELETIRAGRQSDVINRRIEVQALCRSGEEIAVEVTISPVRLGGRYLLSAFLHDVTERRRREAALRLSEERYRLVSRATNDVIRDCNLSTGEIEWSEIASRVFRCPAGELGSTIEWWYERVHPEEREQILVGLQAVVEGMGECWSGEYRFRRGDGSYAVMLDRAYVVRNENGEPRRVVASMLDVTERRRIEEMQRLLAQASAVLDSSLDYEATLANVAKLCVPQLADYSLIDLVDPEAGELRRVGAVHRDPERQRVLRQEERTALDASSEHHPSLSVFHTGEAVLVPDCDPDTVERIGHDAEHRADIREIGLRSFIIVPMISRERTLGTITLAMAESGRRYTPADLVVAENLASRAALAMDNALLLRRSREAVQARDDILAVVSHDLKNPVNTVRISADLALESTPAGAPQHRPLEIIRRCSGEMAHLIQDLLDVSQLDAGRLILDRRTIPLEPLLREAMEAFEPIAEREGVALLRAGESDLPDAWVDPGRIRQVLSNLLGNALKFTPLGGRVELAAAVMEDGDFMVEVRDTGPGIAAEHLDHVFDRFWQARHGSRQGAGLGLAIVSGIVQAHGGSVSVDSIEGSGSTFRFTLPLRAPAGG